MGKLVRVETDDDIAAIVRLADAIWHAHYVPIVGQAQVDYMLDKFQSPDAIDDQLAHGFEYYRIVVDGKDVGYVALVPEPEWVFLSKIYVVRSWRSQGLGALALNQVESRCRELGLQRIRLTVNRHNRDSIAWYATKGFVNCGPFVQDIGNGFVMDDFVMEKTVEVVR